MPDSHLVSLGSNRYSMDDAVITSLTFHRVSRTFSFPSEHEQLLISAIDSDIRMRNIAQQQLMSSYCLAILAFIVQALLNLVGVKYLGKGNSPFETHPATTMVVIACLLGYCLAYGVELRSYSVLNTYAPVVHRVKRLLGSLIVASIASMLLPDMAQPLVYVVHILFAGSPDFYALALKLYTWVQQRNIYESIARQVQQLLVVRSHSILPVTTMDANNIPPI